ncbi:type II secretion system protein [Clostridium sp.]|uniref:PilW family protein n=1 Tax=Clostridium sp. TaxID=1506 RepID=UPI002629B72F|nr:type II secretion system protein [Clostridium sp.]
MKRKRLGFTLVEIIIALAFTVIILGIASSMFITGNKVFSDSDIKSTLQIEGQAIQEKISDIGMQAAAVQDLELDNNNQMNYMKISSYVYDQNGNPILHSFEINKEDTGEVYKNGSKKYKLSIYDEATSSHELISSNVESVSLDDATVTNANMLKNINSIEFNISLKKEDGYSSVEQHVDFRVTFRNK